MNKKTVIKSGILTVATSCALLTSVAIPVLHPLEVSAASGSYVTLNQFSGHPASNLTISGGSYSPNETVEITIVENGALISSTNTKANTNGEFSTTVTLPTKLAQGNAVITATGKTSGQVSKNNYYVSPFTPEITTSAGASDPFAPLSVSGKGYAANETVTINFAGSMSTVNTDANGSFTATKVTTPNVPAASYTLVATGDASGASAVAYQYINSFYASASPSSYYVLPATKLGFNGSGYAANEVITVTDPSDGTVLSTFTAGPDGSFKNAGEFVVPVNFAGLSKTFVLKGKNSNAIATTSSTVGKYFPSVSPSSYYAMPGATVGFNGSGFVPGETIDIMSGTSLVGSIVADTNGQLKNAGGVTIPLSVAGTNQTYKLTGRISQASGSASIQIGNYSPQVTPSTYYATPGSTVSFTGSGYAPGEVVTIFSGTKKIGTLSVGTGGTFKNTGDITVAYSQANTSVNLVLLGSVSQTPQTISFGVGQLSTQLTPSSYYVLPYEAFNVAVSGFAPSETINLMSGTTLLASAVANSGGMATFSNVSVLGNSMHSANLVAVGMTSQATSTSTIGIGSYYASIEASEYYTKPGTTVSISGNGFLANETVTITSGNTSLNTKADAKGNVNSQFIVPFGSLKSSVDVTATGAKSGAVAITTLTLAPYTPAVSPSTYYTAPGSEIIFTASGYAANESVTISLNGKVVGTEMTNTKGAFVSKSYTLPFGSSAVYSLKSNISNVATDLTIGLAQFYAGVQLNSYYGNGGSSVVVSGSGYAANEVIVITAGDVKASVTADSKGSFSKSIVLPYAAPGDLTVTAIGQSSAASALTTFTIATVYNSIELKEYSINSGKAVTFMGNGYFANEPIVVTSSRMTSSYTITSSQNGTVNDSGYILPVDLKAGEMILTITGLYSHTVHTITIYVINPSKR